MRFYIQLLLLVVLTLAVTDAKKKSKYWKDEKYGSKMTKMGRYPGVVDDETRDVDYNRKSKFRSHKHKHEDHNMPHYKKMKHHKKGKYGHHKNMSWLNIQKGSECGLECKRGEVCITGPIDTKPLCVRKKDLKKSMKLFHRYHKKEMKAWKHFQEENYVDMKDDKFVFDDTDKHEKDEHGHKHHKSMAELKHHHVQKALEKPGAKVEEDKVDPPQDVAVAYPKTDETSECSTSQFSQMRTRMMGWFHLLHGQDHLAKKAHGGNGKLKHFYKHSSVKKELREHEGNKCECLKSAMWQFHQMDANSDDIVTEDEIVELGENSMEPCLQPYLTSCDTNADGKFTSNEWCCCFAHVVPPCFKKLDEVRRSGEPVVYMPRCDREGYFMREQCSGETEETYKCWCVDYNGNEYKGTHTNGRAHCSKIALHGLQKTPLV